MNLDDPQPIINDQTVASPPVKYSATQDQVRLSEESRLEDEANRPGYEKGIRQRTFWDSSPTTGSQYGHPNDSSNLWVWI